jgi:hypothetical protein
MEQDLKRARSLLSEKRLNFAVQEAEADPAPETIGALGGIAFVASNPDVRATVYVFADWCDEDEVLPLLERHIPKDKAVYTASATNGNLFFFGSTRLDTPHGGRAEDRLDKMMSKFAGDE